GGDDEAGDEAQRQHDDHADADPFPVETARHDALPSSVAARTASLRSRRSDATVASKNAPECAGFPRPGSEEQSRAQKNRRVRTSMLSRAGASGGVVGSRNEVWGVKRARPSRAVSYPFIRITSS